MVYKFFDKKTGSGVTATSKVWVSANEQLAEKLHKTVIENLKEEKFKQDLETLFGQQI